MPSVNLKRRCDSIRNILPRITNSARLYQRAGRVDDAAREMQKHQEVLAKHPGRCERPGYFRTMQIHATAESLSCWNNPNGAEFPLHFADATATAFAQASNYHAPIAILDFNHDGRNSLFVMEGEKDSAF